MSAEPNKDNRPAAMELQFQKPSYNVGNTAEEEPPSQERLPRRRCFTPCVVVAASVAMRVASDWQDGCGAEEDGGAGGGGSGV